MNNYLHSKNNDLSKYYLYIFLPMIFYGFYKNGILVYSGLKMLLPLMFPIISFSITLIVDYVLHKKVDINEKYVYFIIIAMITSINMNLFLFSLLILLFNLLYEFLLKKTNVNCIAIFKIVMVVLLTILNKNIYSNELELIHKYSFNLMDIIMGRGISGVCSSSIIMIIIAYFILSINTYYKKEIPVISLVTYFLGTIILKIVLHKGIIINGMILFVIVFASAINKYSPITKFKKIIYSVILGLLTLIFTYFINVYDGVIIALLITSLINTYTLK